MKSKLIVLTTVLGVVFLASMAILYLNEENNVSSASAENFPINIPTDTPYPTAIAPGVSVLAIQRFTTSEILTAFANGIEISATNFRIEDKTLKVDICFQKPNNDNWLVFDASIQVGETQIPLDGGRGIEETNTLNNGQRYIFTFADQTNGIPGQEQTVMHDGLPDYRCDALDFQLDTSLNLSKFNLVIKSLLLDRNEGEECTTYRDKVQSILDAKKLGIRLDCVMQEYGSFQSIAEKPASMSQEEAEQFVREAFREAFTLTGPWIFAAEIKQ